jgi:hypothetical protein
MAYQRFLIDSDYRVAVDSRQMEMLVQGDENRLAQAEQRAEMRFMEYLDQHYEIERVFFVGKVIRPYNDGVTYPANAFYKNDDGIFRVVKPINGRKKPTAVQYWEQLTEVFDIPDAERKPKFSQLHTYAVGDIVKFQTEFYVCKVPCGYDFNNIQIPGIKPWLEVKTTPWEPNLDWELNQVCSYNNLFYMLTKKDDTASDVVKTPDVDDNWALIGDYTPDYDYTIGQHDYVVSEGKVFEPVMNVNMDKPEIGNNIAKDDPRNLNVIEHMVNLSVYYLHQMISPTNISTVRVDAYNESILWLSNAARFKINPKIPRKRECETGQEVLDFAVDTYQREFDPYDDMWII